MWKGWRMRRTLNDKARLLILHKRRLLGPTDPPEEYEANMRGPVLLLITTLPPPPPRVLLVSVRWRSLKTDNPFMTVRGGGGRRRTDRPPIDSGIRKFSVDHKIFTRRARGRRMQISLCLPGVVKLPDYCLPSLMASGGSLIKCEQAVSFAIYKGTHCVSMCE